MISQIVKDFRAATNFVAHGEVALFRELAGAIRKNTHSVFIDETHGAHKANVSFTNCLGKRDRCEISDLLIITFAGHNLPLRATFWQAKKEAKSEWASSKALVKQLDFRAQFNQWDLLSRRPRIKGIGNFQPPHDLLGGATSSSIGTFGTFYERNGLIEVFHSVAEFVCCRSPNAVHPLMISPGLDQYSFAHSEAIARRDLQSFLEALFNYQIGSLLLPKKRSHNWLVSYAKSKAIKADPGLSDFFSNYDTTIAFDDFSSDDGISVLVVNAASAV